MSYFSPIERPDKELPTESINFFKVDDLKELKNHDKEKEDIAEADVKARKEGLLNYVGETVLENGLPWYAVKRYVHFFFQFSTTVLETLQKQNLSL